MFMPEHVRPYHRADYRAVGRWTRNRLDKRSKATQQTIVWRFPQSV